MATWYAGATGNLSEIQYYPDAAKTGEPVYWNGLSVGDTLDANGYTVAIDISGWTLAALTTVQAGGGFTINAASAAFTITCNIVAGTTTCLTIAGATNPVTVHGNVTGGSASNAIGITHSTGNLTLNIGSTHGQYTLTGGSAAGTYAIYGTAGLGNSTWNANLTAGTADAVSIFIWTTGRTLTINGTLTSVGSARALRSLNTVGTLALNGSVVMSDGATVFPFDNRGLFQWNADPGRLIQLRDSSNGEVTLKEPDYPAEADVEAGVSYDYATKTGTLAAGGGGGPLIGASALISG